MAKRLKNVKLFEISEIYRRVLSYFFSFPEHPIGLNDLSEQIGSSKTSTKLAVNYLIEQGFLKKEEIGKAWRLSADPKNQLIITKKIPYNLELIYESGIIGAVYDEMPNARAIILFGSYRWGTDNEKSDIDIAVEVLDNKNMKIKILGLIERLGLRKKIRVNLHIFSRNKIDLNLFTNIANGILLDGLLEVHP
ncbi:MAG TPA: nucleotidyltransferase domain-containing protein [Candidatus Nanoarchaeia archaeon]|nr:nucleotidyltransferase domain-containing protein [Candidatus Nanoarchaeia archaeon]